MANRTVDQQELNKLMRDGWSYVALVPKQFSNNDQLELRDNSEHFAVDDIAELSIVLPDSMSPGFRCAIDFGCGDTATSMVYPDSIVWSGDNLDENMKFIPVHNHRYHIDVWHDGSIIRANASGVIIR